MKMNNKMKALVKIVKGVILLAMGLSLMGCEQVKEVENINIQDTNPVVEYCEYCGHEEENGECGACEGYEAAAHLFDDLNDVTRAIFTEHYKNCKFEHTPIDAPQVEEEVEAPTAMTAEEFDNAKCENCGHDVSDVIDNAGGYWCEACDYVK
jgi:hypothetical protein